MTEDGLHALEPRKLVKIHSFLDISIRFTEMRVQSSEQAGPIDVLFLRSLPS